MHADARRLDRSRLRSDLAWAAALGGISLAYLLTLIAVGTGFFFENPGAPQLNVAQVIGLFALTLAQVVAVPLRHRHPLIGFALVVAFVLCAFALSHDRSLAINAPLLFAVWALTSQTRPVVWAPAIAIAGALDLALQLSLYALTVPVGIQLVFAATVRVISDYGVAVPAGLLTRSLRRSAALSARVAEAIEREQGAVVSAAVATERTRMARELHDVAAHHMSGIALQTTALLAVLDSDPRLAHELATGIHAEAERTTRSLREVVGVLRTAESGPAETLPLRTLPELLDTLRHAHPTAEFDLRGDMHDVAPAASLACYRIVQESLSNVRTHATGARTSVRVTAGHRALTVEVQNARSESRPRASGGGGYGLVGMRERASLLGGAFSAQITEDGGWITRAEIPFDALADAS